MSAGPAATANPVGPASPARSPGPAEPSDTFDPSEELVEPSTTARTLRRLRVWLVLICLAAGAMSLFAFSRAHAAVDTISNRSGPAVEQADAAYVAVADANAEAVRGLPYAGPLGDVSAAYKNDLAAANQSLSQLLADNVAGPVATAQLQLVQELVVGYDRQVAQAYADLGQNGSGPALAVADLYYSTTLAGDLQTDLQTLGDDEQQALATQRSSTWLAATGYLVWIPVIVAAIALVLVTDALVRRRFRRRVNLGLSAAALALVAMGVLCGLSLWGSDGDLSAGLNGPLANVTDLANTQVAQASNQWQANLYTQVTKACTSAHQCGADVTQPKDASAQATLPSGQVSPEVLAAQHGFAGAAATADTAYIARAIIIAVLAIAATVLAAIGLWRRIDEYKFEA